MYSHQQYTGEDLPAKYLCLTYDDGPGKHTYEIAKYLHDENVRATFFVVGKYAVHHEDVLTNVTQLGHLIGNHTYDHPDMPYYLSRNGNIQDQVIRTDAVIKKHITPNTIFFRSPYGKWSPEVADNLNMNILSAVSHIGPIYWDIGGVDCFYWKNGHTVESTVEKYLQVIEEKNHGIVVMHDEIADMNFLQDKNRTLELTKSLIPLLKSRGYQFVRLDEIESIKKEMAEPFRFTLKNASGFFLHLDEKNGNAIHVGKKKNVVLNQFLFIDLGHGKIAIKTCNGLFFSLREDKENAIEAVNDKISHYQFFDLVPLSSDQIILRAYNGKFLTTKNTKGGRLLASADYMRGAEIFHYSPVSMKKKTYFSIKDKYQMLKLQFLYVRSKIRQSV